MSIFSGLPQRCLLNAREVADFLGCCRQTIYDLRDSGELEFHQKPESRGKITITRRSVVVHLGVTGHVPSGEMLPELIGICRALPAPHRGFVVNQLSR